MNSIYLNNNFFIIFFCKIPTNTLQMLREEYVLTGVHVANFFNSSYFDQNLLAHHTYTACLYVCWSVCISVFVCSVCHSVCLSVCTVGMCRMFENSAFCTSVCLSVCLSSLLHWLSVYLSVYVCKSLFLYVSMCAADAAFWSCTAVSSRSKMAAFTSKACSAAKGTITPDVK
jgi:hypothetical protein